MSKYINELKYERREYEKCPDFEPTNVTLFGKTLFKLQDCWKKKSCKNVQYSYSDELRCPGIRER